MSPRPRWPRRSPGPGDELPPDFVEPPPAAQTVPMPAAAPPGAPPPPGTYTEEIVGPPGPPVGPPYEEPPPVRALWPWLLLLAIVVIGGLVIAWALTRNNDHHKTRTVVVTQSVRVPDVRGRTQQDAVAAIQRAGLQAVVERRASSRPSGTVIDERPGPGTALARGSNVTLTVSAGKRAPATVRVPAVVGLAATKAVNALSNAGLRPQTKTVVSAKPRDTVVAQSPAAGSSVLKGSVVTLTVSKGQEEVAVPSVVGSTQSAATAALRRAGLIASAFTVASEKPAGTVVAQDPKAGEQVAKGSRVRINVARAATTTPTTTTAPVTTVATTTVATTVTAATTTTATTATTTTARPTARTARVPDVVGETQTQALHALRRAGLRSTVAYVNANLPFDQVVAQYPKPGATLKTGSKVRINVSLGPKPKPQRTVPDVTSQDETTAVQQLRRAGFKVETFDEDTTDPSADGVVLDQDPAAGTKAPAGSVVTIYVGRYTGG